MMGLSEMVHWVGWFLTSLVTLTATVLLLTLILCGGKVFSFSDPTLIFLYLEMAAISSIMIGFLISAFFSKARIAAAVSGILYFGTYMPYVFIAIREETTSASTKWLASLFSPTAFGVAASYIARYEEVGEGLQWHNMAHGLGPCDNFSFLSAMLMMLVDCFLYGGLLWYFNQTMPSYGLAQPWHFFLHWQYWRALLVRPNRRIGAKYGEHELVAGPDSPQLAVHGDADKFEHLPAGQAVGVRVEGLSKVWQEERKRERGGGTALRETMESASNGR